MNIIVLTSYLSTKRGGLENAIFNICFGLSQRGHQICLIYEKEENQIREYQRFCSRTIQIKNYQINPYLLADIIKIPMREDSVIYSNDYTNLFFGYILSSIRGIPLVAHHHLAATLEKNKIRLYKQLLTFSGIRQHIAVSHAIKNDWSKKLRISEKKIDVVYNGIKTDFFQSTNKSLLEQKNLLKIPKNSKVISYVGRLEQVKGIESLLETFALFVKKDIDIKLLIVGKSLFDGKSYEEYLKKLVVELNIDQHVSFLGHVDNVRQIYKVSDVVVLPSLCLEAFGLVIVEAMSCGTPAIASKIGGIPEILTGEFKNWLFEPGDKNSLLAALEEVINWKEKDPQLGNRCRQHIVKNFNIDHMSDDIELILQNVVWNKS